MRNLSFALTTPQFRDRTKDVTRRKGEWWSTVLAPGTLLCGVEKSQGIKKGGLVRLGTIRVVSVTVESLDDLIDAPRYADQRGVAECAREGFWELCPAQFVAMFCKHMKCDTTQVVTRIEFEYVEGSKP